MTPTAAIDELTAYLHAHIPLTRHMGIAVAECSDDRIVLSAPSRNVNHRETAFGGSLSGIAILAGWTWLHHRLRSQARNCRLVIAESTTHFSEPVAGAFEAVCEAPPARDFARFLEILDRRGKARITLDSHVRCNQSVSVRHTGRYVALRQ